MFSTIEPTTTTSLEFLATNRRQVIGSLSLAGLGLLATSVSGQAKTYVVRESSRPKVTVQTSPSPVTHPTAAADLSKLPPEWAHNQGSLLPEYTRYLTSLKLQRVCANQVIAAHAKSKGSVWNILPPKVWWARMGYTLRVADRIALEMGASEVEVVSAYRCPAYNSHCEGAKNGSWHQANVAVDVKFPMAPSLVTATARQLRDLGLFRGGVGGYSDFTHIDSRGQNVNWQG